MFIYPCYQPNQWTRTDVDIFNSQVAAPVSGLKTRPCLTVFHSCKLSYVYCSYTFVYGLMPLSTAFIFKWIVFLSHALEWGSAAWEQSSAELEDGSLGDDESLLCSYINMFKHVKEGTTEKKRLRRKCTKKHKSCWLWTAISETLFWAQTGCGKGLRKLTSFSKPKGKVVSFTHEGRLDNDVKAGKPLCTAKI